MLRLVQRCPGTVKTYLESYYVLPTSTFKPDLWWASNFQTDYQINNEKTNNSSESRFNVVKSCGLERNKLPLYGPTSLIHHLGSHQTQRFEQYEKSQMMSAQRTNVNMSDRLNNFLRPKVYRQLVSKNHRFLKNCLITVEHVEVHDAQYGKTVKMRIVKKK